MPPDMTLAILALSLFLNVAAAIAAVHYRRANKDLQRDLTWIKNLEKTIATQREWNDVFLAPLPRTISISGTDIWSGQEVRISFRDSISELLKHASDDGEEGADGPAEDMGEPEGSPAPEGVGAQ